MAYIHLLVGSTLGAAEYVADHLAALLQATGHQTEIHNPADLDTLLASRPRLLLVVTSTHGAGEVPDNLQPFAEALASRQPDLNALRYGIVSLGDSGYDTFCEGGKTLDRLLEACGATRVGERLEIDASLQELPEDAAEQWLQSWLPQIHHLDLG